MKNTDTTTNLRKILIWGSIAAAIIVGSAFYDKGKPVPKKAEVPPTPIIALV